MTREHHFANMKFKNSNNNNKNKYEQKQPPDAFCTKRSF